MSMLKGLRGIVSDPLFMAGASIYSGQPIGQAMGMMQQAKSQAEQRKLDAEHRKQMQANRDRAFALQQQTFNANQAHRASTLDMARQRFKFDQARAAQGAPNADLRRKLLTAQIAKAKAATAGQELKSRFLGRLLPGGSPALPGAVPGSAPPALIPQNYQGPPQGDPNLIRTQTAAPGQAPPQDPLANLTPGQRQALGMGMAGLKGGNVLLEAEKQGRFGKPAVNKIEANYLNADASIGRLNDIAASFKPEYLELDARLGMEYLKARDKGGGISRMLGLALKPEERERLTGYATFRRRAAENINLYIKEITGAQMSEAEAKRLTLAQANAGQGLFDGDGPTTFKAKLDDALRGARLARARAIYLRRTGRIGENFRFRTADGKGERPPISLDEMQRIMKQRRDELLQDARVPEADREAYMMRTMQEEFGI